MSSSRILLAFLLLFGIIQVTGAIKCFECRYFKFNSEPSGNETCLDPFGGDSKFEVDCGSDEFCVKVVGYQDDGEYKYEDFVSRACGDYDACEQEGVVEADGEYGKASEHCCRGELCNSANAALPGLTMLVTFLFWLV